MTESGHGRGAHAPGAGVGGKRRQDAGSAAGIERADATMASANVRRRGVGTPDLRDG